MTHLILSLFVAAGLLVGAQAQANLDDAGSEATVAAPSYDPTNEDCKCLGPKKSVLPGDNRERTLRIVEAISNGAGSPVPGLDDVETTN